MKTTSLRGGATDAVLFLHPARAVLNGKRAEARHLYGVSGVQLILDHLGERLDDVFGGRGLHDERGRMNEREWSEGHPKNTFVGRNIKSEGLRTPPPDASGLDHHCSRRPTESSATGCG